MIELNTYNPKDNILIKGAKLHNLKNLDVAIPRNKLVVITGLSGSGKSSLAFDTLYAEGQRRYIESLSSYSRQFLGKLDKPLVDSIQGIAPAIAIEQKVNTTNPRSTVGTSTELYDYLKLLYARIGKTFSPLSGNEVKKHSIQDVMDYITSFELRTRLLLMVPVQITDKKHPQKTIDLLVKQGYARIYSKGEILRISEPLDKIPSSFELVIDRIVVQDDEDFINRLKNTIELAFFEGKGGLKVVELNSTKSQEFSNRFELDQIHFTEPNVHFFSFNNPYGACPHCEGYGDIVGIDPDLVIPNTNLSIYEEAIAPWRGKSMRRYLDKLIAASYELNIPIHKPWCELDKEVKALIWKGSKGFIGLDQFFQKLEKKNYKVHNRVLLARFRGKTTCPSCLGTKLKEETSYVKVDGMTIQELVTMPIDELALFFKQITLTDYEHQVAKRLLIEINSRIEYLLKVGLSYLTLNRKSNTLSGGESQRINLATSLGSSLVGSMYILDEPSIGLHPKDTENLIAVLKSLKALGNTVIVVEHDEDIIKAADLIIDIGPEAGSYGGELVAYGDYRQLLASNSLTAQYLNKSLEIAIPNKRRSSKDYIEIKGAREHNLKNIDVKLPLKTLTAISGVSGSGKSTLIKRLIYPIIIKELGGFGQKIGQHTSYELHSKDLKEVEFIDQNPIGKSSRSNPITYIKAYDDIRSLFAKQALSKIRSYQPKHFSFNVDGGRCDKCKGEGEITVEMQFMADIHISCDACNGKRFKREILEVKFEDKTINDILHMTVSDALDFFSKHQQEKIAKKIQPLEDVGLGYVQLGQASSTLSGGEAQRIKLASFLLKGSKDNHTLFIFDEPTTGLHFHDISKLLTSFNALLDKGHSIILIEHNIELLKCADYLIDLGLEGGDKGGYLIASGTPEDVMKDKQSFTAKYLKEKLR